MNDAFGDSRTIPASDEAKKIMRRLTGKGLFNEQRDIWTLGASLGIQYGQTFEKGKRETYQNINTLDPEGIFGAIMVGLYQNLTPEQRLKKLVDYAEWGIREIARKEQNGTLDFSRLGEPEV